MKTREWELIIYTTNSFHADPSGTFMKYQAKAIGSGSEGAQTELQKEYHKVRSYTFRLRPLFF